MVERIDTSQVTFYDVHEEAGQRLDNFLIARLKGVPKSKIYNLIRKGEVRVNKKRADNTQRLIEGDIVRIPPIRQALLPEALPADKLEQFRWLEDQIISESKDFIALNKPYGLACHGGSGVQLGLIEALRSLRPLEKDLELVHRLDRDTSGCLMIAKKRSFLKGMQSLFMAGACHKQYCLVAAGKWPEGKKLITAPLQKITLKSGERVVRVSREGKPSETRFQLIKSTPSHSLVKAYPVSGRTHQIRVHAAFAGCPILGDQKYGDKSANQYFESQGFVRMYLHAEAFSFELNGTAYSFHAPFDPAFQLIVNTFS